MDTTAYMTTAEVAARYRCPESTVRYWRHRGTGPRGIRLGKRVLYPLAEIERFDAERLALDTETVATKGNASGAA